MLSTELKQGRTYQFDVIKNKSSRKFYKIATDDGIEFSLQKFKFQHGLPIPDFIDCYVKSTDPLTLGQDISVFIKEFYKEGEDYDFKIKAIKTDISKVYELEDEHDLCFRLYNAPESLSIGNRVKCKVLRIRGVNVNLTYVGTLTTKLPLEFIDIKGWLNAAGISPSLERLNILDTQYRKLLDSLPEYHSCLQKYDRGDASWIIELLHATSSNITDRLIESKDDRCRLSKTVNRMMLARRIALYILEESDFLRNCNADQRQILQSKLSDQVELFDQYGQAASKIFNKTDEDYINQMFGRLKEAGYLYKPSRQFRIMMTILKLRPELINSRMGELFDALHNWELSNWQSEPFRGALVQQLQIFIKENSGLINMLPTNDSADDNKTIIRIILAIAVQSILATDSDDVDLPVNRAMLYRYISYLYPKNIRHLLDKGIDSILGFERPAEFNWNDTEHPTLLMLKSSHPYLAGEERNNLVKTYTTSKASINLRQGNIHIVARGADPETTAIPNTLVEWLHPRISLADDIKAQIGKKPKDLNIYRRLWDDVAWSIFGEEESAGKKITKIKPYNGEEVRVFIDDVRILNTGKEKQRLQFHCTICDDLYFGEGWMPCDSLHMLGWLTYRDIPCNYNGSLRFAQDSNGAPLLFPAIVIIKDDGMEFSMKSQIEDFLLENSWPGEESACIVTHFDRLNNCWLCLSEIGCTYKVICDETTDGLSEGMLVRIRHVEPEHSVGLTQFFIGEMSDNQENLPLMIKKENCLSNLMQGIGEPADNEMDINSEVVEIEEVMSRDELTEIIYMYQRFAYSEKEYTMAFNYLGFASILCRIAEKQQLLKEISTHMELLMLLQDFGRNQKVNIEWLEQCEGKVISAPLLERLHTRLRIVANLDMNENAEWLWNLRKKPRNDTERELASLVLSYNMMPREMEKTRKEVMKEISTLLNVNSTFSDSKYYGDESQTVEFKSSLIYSTHGGSRPDVKEQMFEIVHTICGFMNARGGTLFIGVNDSGYENGLNDDLAYREAHGQKATIDAMIVELQNHLDRVMPKHAKDHWEIQSDPESKKGVIMVKVLPVEEPVEYEGVIYVRSSSTTKPRLDEQRDEFIKNRSHNYALLMKIWGVGDQTADSGNPTDALEVPMPSGDSTPQEIVDIPAPTDDRPDMPQDATTDIPAISTGRHRMNVLHSYELNFVTPAFFLYFNNDNTIVYSPDDAYLDYEPGCRLALAVLDREKDGFLVLCYSDGNIVKIPLSSFSLLSGRESRNFRNDSSLDFVNIAGAGNYLLSVVRSSFGALFYRIDPLADIAESDTLTALGEKVCDNPYTILAQEIITSDKLPFFDLEAIGKESRFYGIPLPQGDGTLTVQERIDKLLNPVAHAE